MVAAERPRRCAGVVEGEAGNGIRTIVPTRVVVVHASRLVTIMILFFSVIILSFALVAAAQIRWVRVAQAGEFEPGSLTAVKKSFRDKGSKDALLWTGVLVISVVSLVVPIVAFLAAAMWFMLPTGVRYRDEQNPIRWDSESKMFLAMSISFLFLIYVGLFIGLIIFKFWFLGLLPLLAVTAGELALKSMKPKVTA